MKDENGLWVKVAKPFRNPQHNALTKRASLPAVDRAGRLTLIF